MAVQSLESLRDLAVDPTGTDQRAADVRELYATEVPARTMAHNPVVMGDIPAQRPGFQPRPALLAQLSQARQKPSIVVLNGTQGAGKTQLAGAYARARLASGWRLIAWIDARDNESLLAGLAEATVIESATRLANPAAPRYRAPATLTGP